MKDKVHLWHNMKSGIKTSHPILKKNHKWEKTSLNIFLTAGAQPLVQSTFEFWRLQKLLKEKLQLCSHVS